MNKSSSNQLTLRSLRCEMRQVKTLLSRMIDPVARHGEYICVAGSASLLWFILSLPARCEVSECIYRPNDIDVFVYGPLGEHEYHFSAFVSELTKNIEAAGYTITERSQRYNWYVLENEPVLIVDVRVKGISAKLSFVQCPIANTSQEVVDSFDMDIVRVIYDVKDGTITVRDDVRPNILQRRATAKDFVRSHDFPTSGDFTAYGITLSRITKYSKRGFSFSNFPSLRCSLNHLTRRDRVTDFGFPRNLNAAGVKYKIELVLDVLRRSVPGAYLRSHSLGVCGESLLYWMLDVDNCDIVIPAHIRLRAAVLHNIVRVYVCDKITPTPNDFFEFVHDVQLSLWNHGYRHEHCFKHKPPRKLRTLQHATRVRLTNRYWSVEFVWSPGTSSMEQVAEKQLLGIHRVWLNYNTMTLVASDSVKQQLQAGSCRIWPIQLYNVPPGATEQELIDSHTRSIEECYECGWSFLDDLAFLPPSSN